MIQILLTSVNYTRKINKQKKRQKIIPGVPLVVQQVKNSISIHEDSDLIRSLG